MKKILKGNYFKRISVMFFLAVGILSLHSTGITADDSISIVKDTLVYKEKISSEDSDYVNFASKQSTIESPTSANGYLKVREIDFTVNKVDFPSYYEVESAQFILLPYMNVYATTTTPTNNDYFGSTLKLDSSTGKSYPRNSLVTDPRSSTEYDISDSNVYFSSDTHTFSYKKAKDTTLTDIEFDMYPNIDGDVVINPNDDIPYTEVDLKSNDTDSIKVKYNHQYPASLFSKVPAEGAYYLMEVELTYKAKVNVSLTRPNDYTIKPGEKIKLDTTISSKEADGSNTEWYGTFQVKKVGSSKWEDIDPSFMSSLTDNSKPEHTFAPDNSYQGATFRYKYVYKRDTSRVVYSNTSKLKILTNNDNDGNNNDNEDKKVPKTGIDISTLILLVGATTILITTSLAIRRFSN